MNVKVNWHYINKTDFNWTEIFYTFSIFVIDWTHQLEMEGSEIKTHPSFQQNTRFVLVTISFTHGICVHRF